MTSHITLQTAELKFTFIRAPGPGGQNVNKVATAVQLRFDIKRSASLPENVRLRLMAMLSSRITLEGELVIKAHRYRTQERNKQDALMRLQELIERAAKPVKKRKKTKPTLTSIQQRLTKKKLHGKNKLLRQRKIDYED